MERSGVLPITKFSIGEVWVNMVHIVCVSHTLQSAFSVGIGASVLSILRQFLSNLSQHVVDGFRSKLVKVVSEVPPGSILGPLYFLLYTSLFFHTGE